MSKSLPHELINDYVDDRLNETDRQRVEAHLRQHEGDAEAVRQLRQMRTQLRKSRRYKLDDQFSQRVLAAIEQQTGGSPIKHEADEKQVSKESSLKPKVTTGASSTSRLDWRTAAAAITSLAAMLLIALMVVQKPVQQPVAYTAKDSAARKDSQATEAYDGGLVAGIDDKAQANKEDFSLHQKSEKPNALAEAVGGRGRSDMADSVESDDGATESVPQEKQQAGRSALSDATSLGTAPASIKNKESVGAQRPRLARSAPGRSAPESVTSPPMEGGRDLEIETDNRAFAESSKMKRSRSQKLVEKAAPAIPPSTTESRGARYAGGAKMRKGRNEKKADEKKADEKADEEAPAGVAWLDLPQAVAGDSVRQEPLGLVIVSTNLTVDGLAAINEFSVAQAGDSGNGGTFFTQVPSNLERSAKQDDKQEVSEQQQEQPSQQTLVFNVEATDTELTALLAKIGGKSIVRGQVPLSGVTATERQMAMGNANALSESNPQASGGGRGGGGGAEAGLGGGQGGNAQSLDPESSEMGEPSIQPNQGVVVQSIPVIRKPDWVPAKAGEQQKKRFVLVVQLLPPDPVDNLAAESKPADSKSKTKSGSKAESGENSGDGSKRP